jgi:hypothetical protein
MKRPVRLILMEFINGVCMEDLDPNDFTEEERSNIMVKAIAAESAIAFRGVQHKDFAPRNVLCSGNLKSTDLRVAIVDFNVSVVTRLAYGTTPSDSHQLPASPIRRWRRQSPGFGGEWLPPTREKLNEWLWKHWAGSPLYRPVGYAGEDAKAD